MTAPPVTEAELLLIEAFLYREARLADESRYDEWEALLTDDMQYWIPAGRIVDGAADQLSYVNDNRARLGTRLRQLRTGKRHAQTPISPMRRLVSNIEVLEVLDDGYRVGSNMVLYEVSAQATSTVRVWPGRVTHVLRRHDDGLRMAAKTIELITAGLPQPNLAFLL